MKEGEAVALERAPFNISELGWDLNDVINDGGSLLMKYSDVNAGDGILVYAFAPSKYNAGATVATAATCTDSLGNTYTKLYEFHYEAAVPVAAEGARFVVFYCPNSVVGFEHGIHTITVTWDHDAQDKSVTAWVIRHQGGPHEPELVARTADNDAAAYASDQVTLANPGWIADRDNSMMFATIFIARNPGPSAFSAVVGFDFFFQAQFRRRIGALQTYFLNPQTTSATVELTNKWFSDDEGYESDLGDLLATDEVSSARNVGQKFTPGINAWKGIVLWGLD